MGSTAPTSDRFAEASAEPHVALRNVRVSFGDREVLRDLSCAFGRGRISVILGGSGSGKSTLLRVIAGLVYPQSGAVIVAGSDLTRLSERGVAVVRRKIGMMFQGGALLDSMTVFENLALPLREHTKLAPPAVAEVVHQRLAAVGLSNVDALLPRQLSGGMVKRVALARGLIADPEILLCDEPFSGLDPISTKRIEALLRSVNERNGTTMIVVSHHIPSTMRMADRVLALLPGGAVEGTPEELRRSTDPRVVAFLNEDIPDDVADEVEVLPGGDGPR